MAIQGKNKWQTKTFDWIIKNTKNLQIANQMKCQ